MELGSTVALNSEDLHHLLNQPISATQPLTKRLQLQINSQ